MDPQDLLADLDADQRHAVTTESRLVAVIAGAGSGKTRVLTRRIAYRIATETADPRHTLALTFTREAAGELRRRLRQSGLGQRIEAGTFHSVALGLLRQRWSDLGKRFPTIADDRHRLLSAALNLPKEQLDDIVNELSWASARGITADTYSTVARSRRQQPSKAARITEAMAAYEREKSARGVFDLDDLLVRCAIELERDTAFAAAIQWRFRHIHVDEAQDLTPIQQRLLTALRSPDTDDLYIVGDPAQSIYGFNGSDPDVLVHVSDRFPGVEVIKLPVNHRCTPQIVSTGVHILGHADLSADLQSSRPDGSLPSLTAFSDEDAEARGIADAIVRTGDHAVRNGQVAVLGRTHQHCARIEQALKHAGIEVRARGFRGDSSGRRALDQAKRLTSSVALRAWAHDILDGDEVSPAQLEAAQPSGTVSAQQVASVALEHLREHPDGNGTSFASWITTADPFGFQQKGGVEVLTFHAAKGREWDHVWIAAVETGSVPHRSATTREESLEEARLLYVAITRATSECHLSFAERRSGYRRNISPFIAELDLTRPSTSGPPEDLSQAIRRAGESTSRTSLERLKEWRAITAQRSGILPEELCSDRVLRQIAEQPPQDAEQLDKLTGWGRLTSARLFNDLQSALGNQS